MSRNSKNDDFYYTTESCFFCQDELTEINSGQIKPSLGIYNRMFKEDLTNKVSLFPRNAAIQIIGQNFEQMMIVEALSRRASNLNYAIRDFLQSCISSILLHGTAIYEIGYKISKEDEKIVGFQLFYIPPFSIYSVLGRVYQLRPKKIAFQREIPRVKRLKKENIAVFTLPAQITSDLRNVRKCLIKIGQSHDLINEIVSQSIRGESRRYNFLEINYTEKMALANVSRITGWDGRDQFRDDIFEYYSLIRKIRFLRYTINIRDNILSQLDGVIDRVGCKIGFSAQLKYEGLVTLSEVEDAERKLVEGSTPFSEVYQPLLR